MNADVKRRWVAALRSGDYVQGRGALRRPPTPLQSTEYCCLGVLCELAVADGVTTRVDGNYNTTWYGDDGDRSATSLPVGVRDWAELGHCDPAVGSFDGDDVHRLSALNDAGRSFTEIAQLIEDRL